MLTPAEAAPALKVWIESELFDAEHYWKTQQRDNYALGWPLESQQDREKILAIGKDKQVLDYTFDQCVKRAWRMPWMCSGLQLGPLDHRDQANFIISRPPSFDNNTREYLRLASSLQIDKGNIFAVTPFSIITQNVGVVGSTKILFFYSFESFIQECLAVECKQMGVSWPTIVEHYRHTYTNSTLDDFVLADPAKHPLASLVERKIDWNDIVRTKESAGSSLWRPVGVSHSAQFMRRLSLFSMRRAAHLMTAITVACIGLDKFQTGAVKSDLVSVESSAPSLQALSASWLYPVQASEEYAQKYEGLLEALNALQPKPGAAMLQHKIGQTEVEEAIRFVLPSFFGVRDEPSEQWSYRWWLFDVSLDDASINAWTARLMQLEPE